MRTQKSSRILLCDIILCVNTKKALLPSALPDAIPPIEEELLCSALQKTQFDHQLFPQGTGIVVGVSGGADSVCLLHLLLRFAATWDLDLHVAHVDHSLRPNSADDAAFVADLAAQWGAPFHLRQLAAGDLAATGENLEAAARHARYQFLAEVALQVTGSVSGVFTVTVAHTADDQAETLLINLLRGSGLDGLSAMRMRTELTAQGEESSRGEPRIWLVRPFLDIYRTQILRYLEHHNLPWREDPTNQDLHYTRNWLRHEILPQLATFNPNIQPSLNRTAALLAAEADRAEKLNRLALKQLMEEADTETSQTPLSRIVFDRASFLQQDVATQRGVLRAAWRLLNAPSEALTFEQVENVRRLLATTQANAGPIPIAAAFAWSVVGDRFCLHRAAELPLSPRHPFLDAAWRTQRGSVALSIPGTYVVDGWQLRVEEVEIQDLPEDWRTHLPWQAYLDRDRAGHLVLTAPQPAQHFAPLGMSGRHKALGDLFTDRKIHPSLRPGWPLVVNTENGQVLWVCGIQVGHPARITEKTRRVVHLRWDQIVEESSHP
jgi:tRNA(Ile)-lysidine synthase